MKIIVDIMGGDSDCTELARGALMAAAELDVEILLVGDREKASPLIEAFEKKDRIGIVHAPVFITMEDDHYAVRGEKAGSSMVNAMKLLAAGEGDAVVTAGNTGAAITAATLYIKRIRGIRRAALAPILPLGENGVILIDSGANIECTPEYLLQFAYMGSFYAKYASGNPSPSVGLLNVGTEPTKGDPLRLETFALLSRAKREGRLNFIGNIEGRDVPSGAADVVIADGFSGNVLLKSMEGIGLFFYESLKAAIGATAFSKLGGLLVKKHLAPLKKTMNYREIGGSPLIGISAPVIKAHGSSDAFTMMNAIRQAKLYAAGDIVGKITENIDHMKL